MPSLLAWLDHDEAERRRMQEVIELFRERDTVDELGIGSVRDAFSNLLFPARRCCTAALATSSFVPWIYLELERQRVPSSQIAARARRDEIRLIYALIEGGEGEGSGVIGAVARERLKQLPSYAYWNGLEVLRHSALPRIDRPLPPFTRQLLRSCCGSMPRTEGDEPIDGLRPELGRRPAAPARAPARVGELRPDAERGAVPPRADPRLGARVAARCCSSAEHGRLAMSRFPWRHPDVGKLPKELARTLELARVFSEVMHGASLLYNLMLAEARPLHGRVDDYRAPTRGVGWAGHRSEPAGAGTSSGRSRCSATLGFRMPTRRFVERWFELGVRWAGSRDDAGAASIADHAIASGSRRAARRGSTIAALSSSGEEAPEPAQLSYRWPVVERTGQRHPQGVSGARSGDSNARA